MSGDYFEVAFVLPFGHTVLQASLIEKLKSLRIPRDQIVQRTESGKSYVLIYFSSRKRMLSWMEAYRKNPIASVKVKTQFLSYSNWAEKWKNDYQIQVIGKKFVLVPAWRLKSFRSSGYPKRIPVIIDPLSAFGSGEHETTRLVTRMMESLSGKFESFLDVGTGTGILSIFAAYLGASRIFGFDCDKPSTECAKFNFEANLGKLAQADFKCLELARLKHGKFDLVAANINSHILEDFRAQIAGSAKKGGWVLLSGILHQTYGSFRENFDGPDLRCVKVLRGRRWVSVLYRKIR